MSRKLINKLIVGGLIILALVLIWGQASAYLRKPANTEKHSYPAIPQVAHSAEKGRLRRALSPTGFSGTAILIQNNQIVDSYTAGTKDNESGKKNQLTTAYEIDSLQKSLTAGLVMTLVNRHEIALTDHLNQYITGIPGSAEVTIRQLLDMTSGLSLPKLSYKGDSLPRTQYLKILRRNVKFQSQKYGKWNYQPVNYVLLSMILEKVTGDSYQQLFAERYTGKLKLQQTVFATDTTGYDAARGYRLKKQGNMVKQVLQQPNMATVESELGTGQVYMSVPDYYKVLSKLLNGDLLSKQTTQSLYRPINFAQVRYHGGLYTEKQSFYGANGYGYGFEDHVRISPDGKKAFVVFSNLQGNRSNQPSLRQVVDKLTNQYFNIGK
ncbi:serine hydrolase domain-containing protein [Pediococcus acidilactici]|uniref:serine hydrolase domain-containing protein n=1 Tax=Pediococcus acidilactici TaxID=1254 RepID=UPI00194F2E9E|nr:serine hydrolase domain-containing protein [Pediococcus acidilactici]MBM6585930.1 beta-lactamase family protein [Pediococcus acidilactici]